MSFTANIKNEINNIEYEKTEVISELSAVFNIGLNDYGDKKSIIIENISCGRRIFKLIKDAYHVVPCVKTYKSNNFRNKKSVEIILNENADKILKDLSIFDVTGKRMYIPKSFIIADFEQKKAYLRGVFLICGSINDPKTSRYHAEFLISNKSTADFVNSLLNNLSFNSKIIKRDKSYMVYIKEAEKISDFIKLLNAYNALFYYEDIRIYRDHKNMTNRLNNCEQANADKTIFSSNELLKDIEFLKQKIDIGLLDDKLKEIIYYKEKYKESSLLELANIMSGETGKSITKSGINHRIRKLKEIVNKFK